MCIERRSAVTWGEFYVPPLHSERVSDGHRTCELGAGEWISFPNFLGFNIRDCVCFSKRLNQNAN